MRILIVEDERHLADAVEQILKKNNYSTDVVYDGESGLDYGRTDSYDLILLDIMLPKMDGITVLKTLRKEHIQTPVIMLTAKGEVEDTVWGLDAGADDYLAKPFATPELLARIRASLRRKVEITQEGVYTFSDIELNMSNLSLRKGATNIHLTLKEGELLEFLIVRKNMASSKETIIEKIWGYDSEAEHNNVEVYISFLRKKLSFLKSEVSITTVRGVGYLLKESLG